MASKKEKFSVSFEIELEREPESVIMFPREMKQEIKYIVKHHLEDYFKRFKISEMRCAKHK